MTYLKGWTGLWTKKFNELEVKQHLFKLTDISEYAIDIKSGNNIHSIHDYIGIPASKGIIDNFRW